MFYQEPFYDLDRKWALFDQGEIRSILTTTPLEFGWGRASGIAGVATRVADRGRGYAQALLAHVGEIERASGTLLFAKSPRLYERIGFHVLDEVSRAPLLGETTSGIGEAISAGEIERLYNAWASGAPERLRRDARRWSYWRWSLRQCERWGTEGYLCLDQGTVRECLLPESQIPLRHPPGAEWFGLNSVAKKFGLPLGKPNFELYLMGRGVPTVPEMFMTDQF